MAKGHSLAIGRVLTFVWGISGCVKHEAASQIWRGKNLTTLMSCQGKEALSCFKQRSNVMQVLGRCEVKDQWIFRGIFTCITFEWVLENFCVCGDSALTLSHLEALPSTTEGILLEYITQSHLRENVRIKVVRFGFRNI